MGCAWSRDPERRAASAAQRPSAEASAKPPPAAPPPADPPPAGPPLEACAGGRLLGSGSYGDVWVVEEADLALAGCGDAAAVAALQAAAAVGGRPVAVKRPAGPETAAAVDVEAANLRAATAALASNPVALGGIAGYVAHAPGVGLVSRYVPGPTLAEWVSETHGGDPPVAALRALFVDAAATLRALQAALPGFRHSDLHVSNVVVEEAAEAAVAAAAEAAAAPPRHRHRAVLVDFGRAMQARRPPPRAAGGEVDEADGADDARAPAPLPAVPFDCDEADAERLAPRLADMARLATSTTARPGTRARAWLAAVAARVTEARAPGEDGPARCRPDLTWDDLAGVLALEEGA